jgi:hypothetical protein
MSAFSSLLVFVRGLFRGMFGVFSAPLPVTEPLSPSSRRARRERNTRRCEMRALRTSRCRHGRQVRTSPRSRRRRLAPLVSRSPIPAIPSFEVEAVLEAPPIGTVAVRRSSRGDGWEAISSGHRRGPVRESREAAIDDARRRLREGPGGEILVMNETGKVAATLWVLSDLASQLFRHSPSASGRFDRRRAFLAGAAQRGGSR